MMSCHHCLCVSLLTTFTVLTLLVWHYESVLVMRYSITLDNSSTRQLKPFWVLVKLVAAGMVVCLAQSANELHVVQLMPLPPCHRLLH